MTEDSLTAAEETLTIILAERIARQAGQLAKEGGWPPPDEQQAEQLGRTCVGAAVNFVRSLRHPRAAVPTQIQLVDVVEALATAALEQLRPN